MRSSLSNSSRPSGIPLFLNKSIASSGGIILPLSIISLIHSDLRTTELLFSHTRIAFSKEFLNLKMAKLALAILILGVTSTRAEINVSLLREVYFGQVNACISRVYSGSTDPSMYEIEVATSKCLKLMLDRGLSPTSFREQAVAAIVWTFNANPSDELLQYLAFDVESLGTEEVQKAERMLGLYTFHKLKEVIRRPSEKEKRGNRNSFRN